MLIAYVVAVPILMLYIMIAVDQAKLSEDGGIKGEVRYRNRDGDEFILINPSKERLNKKDRFGFTVNQYLDLQVS